MAAIAVLTHSPIFDVLRGYIATLYTLYIAPTFIKAGLVMSQALGIYDAPVCFGFRHYRVCWAHSQVEMAVKLLISLVVVLTLAVIVAPVLAFICRILIWALRPLFASNSAIHIVMDLPELPFCQHCLQRIQQDQPLRKTQCLVPRPTRRMYTTGTRARPIGRTHQHRQSGRRVFVRAAGQLTQLADSAVNTAHTSTERGASWDINAKVRDDKMKDLSQDFRITEQAMAEHVDSMIDFVEKLAVDGKTVLSTTLKCN